MNNFREVELLSRKTVGDSGTETIDIDVTEPITELTVRMYFKNDTAQADEVPPESCVSKIELVDGGRVYASINGYEATAMAWYDKLKWPSAWYSAYLSEGSHVEWPLQFGRYLGDPQYAFSPTRLLNPQLKVTWAKNALHLTAVSTLEVNAKLMEGVSAPSQALLTKAIKTWTTLDSGIVEVDLPTDYPYRRIYFRSFENQSYLGNQWTNFKMECDVGKLILFEMEDDELMSLMERIWGRADYSEFIVVDDGAYHQSHLGFCMHGSFNAFNLSVLVQGSTTLPGYVRMYAREIGAGAAQNDVKTDCRFYGLAPENTYCYPFGRQDDPTTWFNAPGYGSVKLKITEANAGGAASVLVQQPIPLP